MLAALVQVVLPVVLVAAVGYVLARSFELDRQTLNKVGMHGLTPALAFTSIVKTEVSPGQGVWLVAGYVAANVLAGLVAWGVAARWPGRTRRGVVACTVIGNNGNFGLPVALLALGQPGLDQALVIFIVSVVVMFTIGPVLYGSHDGLGAGLRSLVRLPVLWALVLASVVRLTGMTVPVGVMRGIELLAAAAIPLVLLQLGVQLGQSRRIHLTAPVLLSVGLRSVGLPLLGLAGAASSSRSVTRRIPRWRNSSGYFLGAGMNPPSRWIAASTRPGAVQFRVSRHGRCREDGAFTTTRP
ncbi:AEC family transporter [Arsenicicoccus sp. MKL-02]|uniref:AEC family transporter n=1 Tax=Arsenicicoccus cauae TaxID=2663847 RepID=A0A6I3IPW1_9MICO|nr:AEC family transporter [Arsenicicoccus cauae]MTB70391.1 AEC family transporter [Arsenicicoccus cauae]